MLRQASQRRVVVPNKPAAMINRPTVVPTVEAGGSLPNLGTDKYFALKVSTAGLSEAVKVVLFDGGRGYQLGFNFAMDPAVNIIGLTAQYQFILNDIVHNATFFDVIKQRVVSLDPQISNDQVALSQFARPIKVYDSSKGSEPRLLKTIYPDMGIHEGQYQLSINTFSDHTIITNRTALVYEQEPDCEVLFGIYQKAELGRKQ
ncbi:hypothetical protein [Flavilitoribacter nigricans]|nr:hypothetical protein [Flavilitoribacter nigricans]